MHPAQLATTGAGGGGAGSNFADPALTSNVVPSDVSAAASASITALAPTPTVPPVPPTGAGGSSSGAGIGLLLAGLLLFGALRARRSRGRVA